MKKKILTIFLPGLMLIMVFWGKPQTSNALSGGWSITVPATVNLPDIQWSIDQQQNTVDFTAPIVVSNDQTSSDALSLQVTATEFSEHLDQTLFIGYDNLEIKTGNVATDQPDGISAPLNNTYSAFNGAFSVSNALDIMAADNRNRNAGSWSITPSLRLTIPAKQKSGSYNTVLTFSLI